MHFHILDIRIWLILAGAFFLTASLFPVKRIIDNLPSGGHRRGWKLLGIFILFFIFGYFTYIFKVQGSISGFPDLIVPFVFFFGGLFVLMVAQLTLQTNLQVRRVVALEKENLTDPLTGLYNRRHLDAQLLQEIKRAHRYGLPLSVLLLDLDHFKGINDTHGHQVGDGVLMNLASRLRCLLRENDFAARYGGEEFAVIAPHTSLVEAEKLAERIRRDLEANSLMRSCLDRNTETITVSIGVACLEDDVENSCILIRRADQALYRAKKAGRNRVRAYKNRQALNNGDTSFDAPLA